MLIGSILQIIIALIFIYLISSLIVSELQEQFASLMEFRATNLRKAIDIFVGESIRKDLYEKNLIE